MPVTIHRLLLLAPLLWLGGCATLSDTAHSPAPADAMTQALQAGDCRAAYGLLETAAAAAPEQRLRVGQVCLQSGDFNRARRVTANFDRDFPGHPDGDYVVYLHVLAGFGEWSRSSAAPAEIRVDEGRALFQEMVAYSRERPLAEYSDDLAPRLVRLREDIAGAELVLAQHAERRGNHAEAKARAEYVLEFYPRTQAAADAARLLMTITGG